MSKSSDARRKKAARARYRAELRKWNAAMRLARAYFWQFQALAYPNGSRFRAGTDRAKHMRGYWDQVELIARTKFGGRKPRNMIGLNTGKLTTGHLSSGGLDTGHL